MPYLAIEQINIQTRGLFGSHAACCVYSVACTVHSMLATSSVQCVCVCVCVEYVQRLKKHGYNTREDLKTCMTCHLIRYLCVTFVHVSDKLIHVALLFVARAKFVIYAHAQLRCQP